MKIIIDTNVYFSAFVFDRGILNLTDYCFENCLIYSSLSILGELRDVLTRDKIKKLMPSYSLEKVELFLTKIFNESTIVYPNTLISICRDSKDNQFLELATEIQADYIITGDKDLLSIERLEKTNILTPKQFIIRHNLSL